ncbi:MAG: 2-dehydropantoate 2-reductase [uncultured Rubrobacteraceae bacterium]|uniref:2-dehydropantoate 2-reductase n=1 Tax=uncultured Rubrobacteraceae bacterium TaxID=349277 RepID=A0A6J4QNF9_9ACTN|nr:MAG: 2-dehydropantoate 2-reductase [uncultured Rubrobacteraceae bacterium]
MEDLRDTSITIVGAGAIGGTVGAYLDEAGYDVTLVDVSPEHVEAIRERGLRIMGARGDKTFHPRIILSEDLSEPLGSTFLCVKGHFTEGAVRALGPLLAPDGYILSLQNGLNEALIAERIGRERTVGAFVHFGADLLEPGLIQLGYEATIQVGELDGSITPRVEALREALGHAMSTKVTDNIWGFLWGKLVFGATGFVVSCVDAPVAEVIDHPLGRSLCRAASVEAYLVAHTQVERLESIGEFESESFAPGAGMEERADETLTALADAWRGAIKQHMGIWRDLKVKRRKTEVDMQVGQIVAIGREQGIPTPVNAAVLEVVHEIENGERGMGWGNLREISDRSGFESSG